MTDTVIERASATAAKILPQRLHHLAQVVKDHKATRHFYEDIIGMPLVATWAEEGTVPEFPDETVHYCHAFYALAEGGALAFFQFARPDVHEIYKYKTQTGYNHFALMVSREGQDEIQARLEAAGIAPMVMDHGYCRSIYTTDPDGLTLEFTSDPDNADEIAATQEKTAHATLSRWLAGDHTPNNDLHHR